MAGVWCEDAVDTVCQAGLMQGRSDGSFGPASPLTHAQIVTVCARLNSLLTGGDGVIESAPGEPWYQGSYDVLWSVMEGKELFIPFYLDRDWGYPLEANTPCTREDFVRTLSYALLDTGVELPALNTVTALPDVRWSSEFGNISGSVLDFYWAGILTGSDEYGTFGGSGTLNRGQAAAILARLVDPSQRVTLHLKQFSLCRDVMGLDPDTVLAVIDGTKITADQAALIMAFNDRSGTLSHLRDTVAMMRLAQERGLTWDAGSQAYADSDGYRGVSAQGWAWYLLHSTLFTLLNGAPSDPHDAADGFYDALYAEIAAKAALLSVETTAAFDAFDFDSFHTRLKDTPF